MMAGYLNAPSPFMDGWFPTGDILRRDSCGLYHFVDRIDFMIKTGGENVAPTEVEAALITHSAVDECAVFGLPDDDLGEIVVAVVVCKPQSSCSEQSLIDYCRTRIAAFKRPRRIVFVSELPKTALGKVAKADLIASMSEGSAPA